MEEHLSEPEARRAARTIAVERSVTTPSSILDAHSTVEAVALLGMHGPLAMPLARGEDLLQLLQSGVLGPRVLINLATAPELARIARRTNGFEIGAMVTLDRLLDQPSMPTALLEAVQQTSRLSDKATLGGNLLQRPQCAYFRNPATACFKKGGATCPAASAPVDSYPGALYPGVCHAAHPSDLAPALIALDAQAEIAAWDGTRRQSLRSLFADAAFNREGEAQLAQDELLTAVSVPEGPSAQAFVSVPLNAGAAVAVAAVLDIDHSVIGDVRIVAGGVAPGPFVFGRAGDLLLGRRAGDIDAERLAAELVQVEVRLPIALRASAARLAIERALSTALQRR